MCGYAIGAKYITGEAIREIATGVLAVDLHNQGDIDVG